MDEKRYDTPLGPIRYWTGGRPEAGGRTLVFLPGLTADHRLFDAQLRHFEGRFRVLVWDAPGHGASRPFSLTFTLRDLARWLYEILDRERVGAPVLVGQSMGGYVGQALMAQFPGRLKGFIAIDSAPLRRSGVTGPELWMLKRMEAVYRWYPWKLLLKQGSEGCAVSPQGRSMMRGMMAGYDHRYYARLAGHGFRILAEAMEANLLERIDCPALLICGDRDQAGLTRRYNRAWHAEAGIPLVWIRNAGHNSNADQPEQVNQAMENFLSSLPPE